MWLKVYYHLWHPEFNTHTTFALICSARFRRSCSIVVIDIQHAGYLFLERNWSVGKHHWGSSQCSSLWVQMSAHVSYLCTVLFSASTCCMPINTSTRSSFKYCIEQDVVVGWNYRKRRKSAKMSPLYLEQCGFSCLFYIIISIPSITLYKTLYIVRWKQFQ